MLLIVNGIRWFEMIWKRRFISSNQCEWFCDTFPFISSLEENSVHNESQGRHGIQLHLIYTTIRIEQEWWVHHQRISKSPHVVLFKRPNRHHMSMVVVILLNLALHLVELTWVLELFCRPLSASSFTIESQQMSLPLLFRNHYWTGSFAINIESQEGHWSHRKESGGNEECRHRGSSKTNAQVRSFVFTSLHSLPFSLCIVWTITRRENALLFRPWEASLSSDT
jgi:hypothetical protein